LVWGISSSKSFPTLNLKIRYTSETQLVKIINGEKEATHVSIGQMSMMYEINK